MDIKKSILGLIPKNSDHLPALKHDNFEVRYFSSLSDIFKILLDRDIENVALLNSDLNSVEHNFDYIQTLLAQNKSVPMALFYKKDIKEQLH